MDIRAIIEGCRENAFQCNKCSFCKDSCYFVRRPGAWNEEEIMQRLGGEEGGLYEFKPEFEIPGWDIVTLPIYKWVTCGWKWVPDLSGKGRFVFYREDWPPDCNGS